MKFSIFLLIITGCSQLSSLETKNTKNHVVYIHHSWAYYFESIEDMINCSVFVVVGTAMKTLSVENISNTALTHPVTSIEFKIDKILLNKTEQVVLDSIILLNPGGKINGVNYISDLLPINHGEKVILFLTPASPGKFVLINPQGRFIIEDDFVFTVHHNNTKADMVIPNFQSLLLEDFVTKYFPK